MDTKNDDQIKLRVFLSSAAEKIYTFLATDSGRRAFWAESADEVDGMIHFHFSNGMKHKGRILESIPNRRFSVEYFGGSQVTFDLAADEKGGTVVTLTETVIPEGTWVEQRAGWVSVLLTLKAAVDYAIDLRNPDPGKSWQKGYVDV